MNSAVISNSARFLLLLAAQVIIFDNLNFFGYINPYPYLLFIILYPVNGNRYGLLISSFFLGLMVDMFSNSGGVHAAACIVLAYFRPYIFKFSFGLSYEYQTVRLNDVLTTERFSFILLSVAIHHLTLFLLEVFKINFIWDIILRTLFSAVFTIIFTIILIYLFKPARR